MPDVSLTSDYPILVTTGVFLVTIIAQHAISRTKQSFVTESVVATFVGFVVSICLCFTPEQLNFVPSTFFHFLLPPIIFEAGFGLKKTYFFKNFLGICLLAVVGTLVSTLVSGFSLYAMVRAGWTTGLDVENSPMPSLAYGALLSATDPVATLAILGAMNVDPELYALIFGESVLNDAVSIVLFKTFIKFADKSTFSDTDAGAAVGTFVEVFVSSLLIGLAFGLIASFIMKRLKPNGELVAIEVGILITPAYIAYTLADATGQSGLMALFFCGVSMSHYALYSMSEEAKIATTSVFRFLAFTTETVVFLYVGVQVLPTLTHSCHRFAYPDAPATLPILTMLVLLVARAVHVFPIAMLLNLIRKPGQERIQKRSMTLLWFAGLRGAIAFALSLEMNEAAPKSTGVVVSTLWIVLFTNCIVGGLTAPVMKLLKVRTGERIRSDEIRSGSVFTASGRFSKVVLEDQTKGDERTAYHTQSFSELIRAKKWHHVWRRVDEKILKPLVGGRSRAAADGLAVADQGLRGSLLTDRERELTATPSSDAPMAAAHRDSDGSAL